MNDFFLAKNASLKMDFDDIEVHQIRMRDFDLWVSCVEPIKEFVKGKNLSDEIVFGKTQPPLISATTKKQVNALRLYVECCLNL